MRNKSLAQAQQLLSRMTGRSGVKRVSVMTRSLVLLLVVLTETQSIPILNGDWKIRSGHTRRFPHFFESLRSYQSIYSQLLLF